MSTPTPINVLSLFDGISVAQQSLKELEIPINTYYASEIEKNPIKVTQHHFPDTIQLGDVRNVNGFDLPTIDLMVFGSPCQSMSIINKNREGIHGEKSGLFFEAVRILNEAKPKYFLMENVGSMSKVDKKIIDDTLGVRGVVINSNLVSAQNRKRIYWTNIPNVTKPKDKKILLNDILENGFADRKKSNCILTQNIPYTRNGLDRYLNKSLGQIVFTHESNTKVSKKDKMLTFDFYTKDGIIKENYNWLFRPMTTIELERLQTLPDGYVDDILKKTPAHHALGNSFTKEVIKHILSYAKF